MPRSTAAAHIAAAKGEAWNAASDHGDSGRPRRWSTEEKIEKVDLLVTKIGIAYPCHDWVLKRAILLNESKEFKKFVTSAIFVAALLVAVQTYNIESHGVKAFLNAMDFLVLVVFIFEVAIKLAAEGKTPWQFFEDRWNVFDFFVVAMSFVPLPGDSGATVTAFRILRLLRVLKLVKSLPKLQVLTYGLIASLSSVGYVSMLLVVTFYFYSCAGVIFFGRNDPVYMGSVATVMLTLFRCSTLEDWTDVMYTSMYGCENYGYDGMEHLCVHSEAKYLTSIFFHCSFVLISSLLLMNLFIGVVATSVQEAKQRIVDQHMRDAINKTKHEKTENERYAEMCDILRKAAKELEEFAATELRKSDPKLVRTMSALFGSKGLLGSPIEEMALESEPRQAQDEATTAPSNYLVAAEKPDGHDGTKQGQQVADLKDGRVENPGGGKTNNTRASGKKKAFHLAEAIQGKESERVGALERELATARREIDKLHQELARLSPSPKKTPHEGGNDTHDDVEQAIKDGFVSPMASPAEKQEKPRSGSIAGKDSRAGKYVVEQRLKFAEIEGDPAEDESILFLD